MTYTAEGARKATEEILKYVEDNDLEEKYKDTDFSYLYDDGE